MKYVAEIDGRPLSVELDERNGQVRVTIEEREYQLEVARPGNGVYLLFDGANVHEATVSADAGGSLNVKLSGRTFTARVIDRKHRATTVERVIEGRQVLTAPMPGKVARVLLSPGDEVSSGQGVVVVEAMKMQNEVKSPKSGRVAEVRVAEGETVSANQVVAVVE